MTKREKLAEWLRTAPEGVLLESQVVGSGLSAALNELLREGQADIIEHPTVRERSGIPATGVILRSRRAEIEARYAAKGGEDAGVAPGASA